MMKVRKAYILSLILSSFYLFPVTALVPVTALAKGFCYQEYSENRCILASACYAANSVLSPDLRSDNPDSTCDLENCLNVDHPLRSVLACQLNPDIPFHIVTGFSDESFNPALNYGKLQISKDNHVLSIPLYLLKASFLC
jgi:hypothetical protein